MVEICIVHSVDEIRIFLNRFNVFLSRNYEWEVLFVTFSDSLKQMSVVKGRTDSFIS